MQWRYGSIRPKADQPSRYNPPMTNERRLPDGRVELIDTTRIEASALYNHDLAPVPVARNWSTYNYAALWISDGALHPDLHARLGAHGVGHELVAGDLHDPPGQYDRPDPDPAELSPRNQVRHSRSLRAPTAPSARTCRR